MGAQGRCEQRSEVIVKIQEKNMFFFFFFFFFFFLGGGGGGGGGQVGGGVTVDLNEELKFFFENLKK